MWKEGQMADIETQKKRPTQKQKVRSKTHINVQRSS